MHQLTAQIKQQARQIGFDLCGIAPAEPSRFKDYFRDWLTSGQAGEMRWLHERFDERTDPTIYLPGARSVICLATNYYSPSPPYTGERAGVRGRVARYALGDDYHEVIKSKLHKLADWIHKLAPNAQTRCAVDTAPLMEKQLAARSGIGWLGKNTCVINEKIGSWVFLAEIVTTLELPPDNAAIDRCGTCTRCIDACPTQAITAPYQLDARRCISYLTIELRDKIPDEFQSGVGEWLFGCDICQDVCPWNNQPPTTSDSAFHSRFGDDKIDLNDLLNWQPEEYASRLRHSAMKRVKLPVLKQNAKIVLENLNSDGPPMGHRFAPIRKK